jgi:CheY-like chemotaxis protein
MTSFAFSVVEPSQVVSSKPKLLVVDDEQDNLDLLYRTFRRDFTVFRADSGAKALAILAKEGEMAVIISDQRMPEMKGTEFLSRTVLDFPDTMRVVLTGYTDITDLIEAINSGQVHKYITKPWEPEHLKCVISEASHIYDLLKRRSEQLLRSQAQNALLAVIVQIAQNSHQLTDGMLPLAKAFEQNFAADGVVLRLVQNGHFLEIGATCGQDFWNVEADALVINAIALGKSQVALDSQGQAYGTSIAMAISFRDQVLGILAMRWRQPMAINLGDVVAIQQCVDEVAIALTCISFYAR